MEYRRTPKNVIFQNGISRVFWNDQSALKRKIPNWSISLFLNDVSHMNTDSNGFFCYVSIAEIMIGVMMKVIQTSTTCINMMNIHILKS